ncbi:hypothetical protein MBLNU13_g07267t3 [Cladosporium sp. NU13]
MASSHKNSSIQAFSPTTSSSSPTKQVPSSSIGDSFTSEELHEALKPPPIEPWQPKVEYLECEIRDLHPGPRAVTFMGRAANIFDVAIAPKFPRSAKGCVKLCVKDDHDAVTVRVWYANRYPQVKLGSLVSIWTNHISNGESGNVSSATAPLFASLFPERDRSCHIMIHENTDDGTMFKRPLGHREGRQKADLMTLQNFFDGGYNVVGARILVVVKSLGQRKRVERKDGSSTENINIQVHDDTAGATFGLWGTSALSPTGGFSTTDTTETTDATAKSNAPWKAGETVLLLEAPGWKIGRGTYLSLTTTTIVDVDPAISDADWLRRWASRQKVQEAINPPFPEGVFDFNALITSPLRCLYTFGDLNEFARAAPQETFQGYLSVLVMEVRLLENWKRGMLMCGECCFMSIYANALEATCKGCDKKVELRPNPRILGQVIDETASVASGRLLLSAKAWHELLGHPAEEILRFSQEKLAYIAGHLLFSRLILQFGWTGDESKAGGRVCVMGVMAG